MDSLFADQEETNFDMAIRSGAKAIILRNGKILLNQCRHSDGRIYYDLPGGGQNQYESLDQAVVREVLEETGLTVRIKRFAALAEEIYTDEILRRDYPDYRMLSRLQGRECCKVYGDDKDRALLLEERILPGMVLREERSLEKRVEVLANVFRKIHLPQQEGETYLNWLNKAHAFCESQNVSDELARLAGQARDICAELFDKYPEEDLRKALFMEAVLATVWCVEDGMPIRERWMNLCF